MNRIERAARRPEFLTFDETAQLLRTSKPTLRKWIQRGLVPGKKVGRKRSIPRDLRRLRQARRFGKVRTGGTRLSSAMDVNGFNSEERRTKKGISRVVRFRLGGQETVEIFLDAAYTRRDTEDARRRPSRFSTAKKLDEPLDRKTRLYFESAPPDLLKRFVALGFSPARGASRVVDVWQTFQAAKSSTVLSLGAKASSSLGFALTFRRRFVSTN
ncbi:MAG: helix-turn-helix domain-containing protein [Thermoguttaceae bacterium]|nr:helix-turn-helix domain-containing protein [Thermoguttaceae bacterium]